jgi:uncharacterized repeat protein (TIGR01451 family)
MKHQDTKHRFTKHGLKKQNTLSWLHAAFVCVMIAAVAPAALAEVTLTTSVERVTVQAETSASDTDTGFLTEVLPGDVLRYTIQFENTSTQDVAAGSVVITNPLPDDTVYLEGSAAGTNTLITFSVDGENFASPDALVVGEGAAARAASAQDYRAIRWTYVPLLAAGESSEVSFELLIP